ncbi:MAG: hypothetical protein AAGJ46_21230 [Planctomycetota bacterium]
MALTASGGRVWERERRPVWDRYVVERYPFDRGDWAVMSVAGYSRAAVDDFLRVGEEHAFWGPANTLRRQRQAVAATLPLIRWRPTQEVHITNVVSSSDTYRWRCDWDGLNRSRTWWRTPDELATLFAHD